MTMWTADDIKSLRLRLGWSAAEFSRHFGCLVDLVLDWERGLQSPSPDDVLQLNRLKFHSETYADQVTRDPIAERMLKEMKLEQICQIDFTDLNKKI